MEERLNFLDNIKAISIFGIIIYHCLYKYDTGTTWSNFYMGVPLFFAVNGYLMLRKERELKTIMRKNIKIVLLVLVWGVIFTSACMVYKNDSFSIINLGQHIIKLDLYYCNYLWFLCILIGLNCINPFISKYVNNGGNILYLTIIVCLTSFMGPLISHFNVIGRCCWLFYYIGGYCLVSSLIDVKRCESPNKIVCGGG